MGYIEDYETFLERAGSCLESVHDRAGAGRARGMRGRMMPVRRKNGGEHVVVPLHASSRSTAEDRIQTNLAPIIWHQDCQRGLRSNWQWRRLSRQPYEFRISCDPRKIGLVVGDLSDLRWQPLSGVESCAFRADEFVHAAIIPIIPSFDHKFAKQEERDDYGRQILAA